MGFSCVFLFFASILCVIVVVAVVVVVSRSGRRRRAVCFAVACMIAAVRCFLGNRHRFVLVVRSAEGSQVK